MKRYANIALPVPLAHTFTYLIPQQFEGLVKRGSLVVVPFGNKILTGVVLNFPETSEHRSLKSISDILDVSLTEQTVTLAEWLAEYYAAPIGESIRLFFPAGMSNISKRIISLSEKIDELVLSQQIKKSAQKIKIITALRSVKELTVAQLRKKTGIKSIYASLNELAALNIVSIREQQKKKIKTKLEWFFTKNNDEENIQFRSAVQKKMWDAISVFSNEEHEVKIFLQSIAGSLIILKTLAKKNYVSLYQKEVERRTVIEMDEHTAKSISIKLNHHQQQSFDSISSAIHSGKNTTFLLHGITGSGKTQVYIEAIRVALALGKTAIVLIPEISLTPQTVKRFQLHFGDAVVWMHSRMSDPERYDAWQRIKRKQYSIVIGPRSALFAPFDNLGLIVVDEEHESSYKQFDASPRYHARDVAIMRGAQEHAVVLLGSATPSIESYTNAVTGKFTLLQLPERADNAVLPPVRIINMIEERKKIFIDAKVRAKEVGKSAFENISHSISKILEDHIRIRLEKKEGVILLQNRRGFAPFLECVDCGHIEMCERCSVTMTYHTTKKHLRCHYCGKVKQAPTQCPQCKGFNYTMRGFGTQRVEQELTAIFPEAIILRMDMDTTTRKGSHEKILKQFGEGKADILLGTQMVAKGLDFPRVTLVGVISADTQMMLPDFRSAERTFQLLTQVAGRAGRSVLAGEVIIQTSQPTHYALKHVLDHDFVGFYIEEIEFRKSVLYPPYSRIIVIEFKGKNESNVEKISMEFGKHLLPLFVPGVILGPSPAVLAKINNQFRWQIIVKADRERDKSSSHTRANILHIARFISAKALKCSVKISIDVDPAGIM